jgi:hypothetical protein
MTARLAIARVLTTLAAALPLLPSRQSGPPFSKIDGRLDARREFPAVVL